MLFGKITLRGVVMPTYQCPGCPLMFDNRDALRQHIFDVHIDPECADPIEELTRLVNSAKIKKD